MAHAITLLFGVLLAPLGLVVCAVAAFKANLQIIAASSSIEQS